MIIPETCWFRIFEIAKLLRELGVKSYAIPNIEIVRRDEVTKHNNFHKILANNYLCESIFRRHCDIPIDYIGYGLDGVVMKPKNYQGGIINYLFIGGMNAFSRKNILLTCEGFALAYEKNNKIHLTCTIQKTNSLEVGVQEQINRYRQHPGMTLVETHLSHHDIMDLYYSHHINIQVSKHEGLGIGFYEGICTGTPVLTIKTPPHNEIIRDGINGWVIDCVHTKMTDNKDPLFDSAIFNPTVLAEKILAVSDCQVIETVCQKLRQDLTDRLGIEVFAQKFIGSLE